MRRLLPAVLAALLWVPAVASAQAPRDPPWIFRSRIVLTGNSDHSEPAGFTVYSAVTLEAALGRALGRRFEFEVSARSESREVDRIRSAGANERLGSLELLPVTATILFRPGGGRIRPYLGAGANLTVAWEKSGVLDSLDVAGHVGPAVQLGADVRLGGGAVFNVDVRWNTLTTDIDGTTGRFARLRIDPIALGVGVGFRF